MVKWGKIFWVLVFFLGALQRDCYASLAGKHDELLESELLDDNSEPASPEMCEFVVSVLVEMQVKNRDNWSIRRFSSAGVAKFGYRNAFAFEMPFDPLSRRYIVISQGWFDELPVITRKALIAHEVGHLEQRHTYGGILTRIWYMPLFTGIFGLPVICAFDRWFEYKADECMLNAGYGDGAIDLLSRFGEPEATVSNWAKGIFADHPTPVQRIARLQSLARKRGVFLRRPA